jgi:hypothetical protein
MPPRPTKARLNAQQKRETAVRARLSGLGWDEVAREAGYASRGAAWKAVSDHLEGNPSPSVEQLREIENMKLDALEAVCIEVIRRGHVVIQQGKIVGRFSGWVRDPDNPDQIYRDPDSGKPIPLLEEVPDDGPVMQAVSTLRGLMDRRAKMNGLDKPFKISVEDEKETDDDIDKMLADLLNNTIPAPPGHPG